MTLAVSAGTDEHLRGAERGSGDVVDRGPSVVIVLMEADEVVLVRQQREAVTSETVELVQERLKPGESPLEAAIRGVAEECGVSASMWEEHGSFWAVARLFEPARPRVLGQARPGSGGSWLNGRTVPHRRPRRAARRRDLDRRVERRSALVRREAK